MIDDILRSDHCHWWNVGREYVGLVFVMFFGRKLGPGQHRELCGPGLWIGEEGQPGKARSDYVKNTLERRRREVKYFRHLSRLCIKILGKAKTFCLGSTSTVNSKDPNWTTLLSCLCNVSSDGPPCVNQPLGKKSRNLSRMFALPVRLPHASLSHSAMRFRSFD